MNLYTTIDEFPVYNWFKCIENKEYKYTLIDVNKYTDKQKNKCEDAFNTLYCEFIDTFGISRELGDIVAIQKQILVLEIDIALGKKSAKTFLNIKKLELEEKLNVEKPKTNTHKVAIEKYLGFRLNLKETTVTEYYNYLEALKQSNG